jgi:HK97 family phage major capsid protein
MPGQAKSPEKSKLQYRSVTLDRSALNIEAREVSLAFASEEPVERWDWRTGKTYFEILDHTDAKSADLSRLNNGGQLLFEHDRRAKLGGVVKGSAKVDADKKSRAVVKLSRSAQAEQELQDIQDGIPRNVSFGYETLGMIKSEVRDGVEYRTYAWAAFEISLVTIEADTTVGIGRSKDPVDDSARVNVEVLHQNLTEDDKMKLRTLLLRDADKNGGGGSATPPQLDESKIRSAALGDDRKRAREIMKSLDEYIKDHGDKDEGKLAGQLRTLASECLYGEQPTTVDEFQRRAMAQVIKAKPARELRMVDLGFDERDQKSYSLVRAIQNCIKRGNPLPDPDTVEGAAHVRMAKLDLGFSPGGFLVPADANIHSRTLGREERRLLQRDLTATNFNQGGATVATELALPIIEILRNQMVTDRLGVRTISGLTGNITIPRQTATATAYSVAETAALTLSTQALDQIALTPHRVGAMNRYSKQLLLQSSIDVENFVRSDLLSVIALDWDRLTLNGQGAGAEPLGVINTPGVGSIVFGAAATFAKLVSFETAIAVLNAPANGRAYATTSAAKGVLKSAAKLLTGATTVAAVALWEDDMINGYPAVDSQQIPNNLMLFGAWPEVIRGLWGGFDVVIDPYSLASQAEVQITMNTWGDAVLRHPQSFCVSADSAAQ